MAVTYEVFTGSLGTGTGNRDITHATETATPKGVIVVISGQAGTAGVQDNAGFSILYVDQNGDMAGDSTNTRHGRPTVEAHRRINAVDSAFVGLDPNGDPATGFSITSATLISGGVRLNIGTAAGSDWNVLVVAFFGDGCTTKLRSGTLPTSGSTNFEHATGVTTEALFLSSTDGATDSNSVHGAMGLGMFAGSNDRCVRWGEEDGAGSGQVFARLETTHAHRNIFNANAFGAHDVSAHTDGWTVTNAASGSNDATMFSLNIDGVDVYCGFGSSPTSTGVQSIESPGFEPAMVCMAMSLVDTVQSNRENSEAGGFAFAAFTADAIASVSMNAEDGAGTTNTQSRFSDTSARLDLHDGSAGIECTLDSFDSLGFNLDWTTVDATARDFIYLAFAEDLGSGTQDIQPTSIGSAEAFGSPTVTPGAVDIAPTSIGSEEAFGTPALSLGIAPTSIGSAEAFGSPTVTTGPVDIAPTSIASAETFGTPTVSLPGSAQIIGPDSIIPPDDQIGTPTVTTGAVTVTPTSIGSEEAFGTPLVVLGQVIHVTEGIRPPDFQVGVPAVANKTQIIGPSSIGPGEDFGVPTMEFTPTSLAGPAPTPGVVQVTLASEGRPITQGLAATGSFATVTLTNGAPTVAQAIHWLLARNYTFNINAGTTFYADLPQLLDTSSLIGGPVFYLHVSNASGSGIRVRSGVSTILTLAPGQAGQVFLASRDPITWVGFGGS